MVEILKTGPKRLGVERWWISNVGRILLQWPCKANRVFLPLVIRTNLNLEIKIILFFKGVLDPQSFFFHLCWYMEGETS